MELLRRHLVRHYSSENLLERILASLRADGKDPDQLRPKDLAPIDEFHIRGRRATIDLAAAVRPASGMHVLDLGSGLGGPSRFLAKEYGCRVTGLDICADYCRTARTLAGLTALGSGIDYLTGDASCLPFAAGCFDLVWTQHTAMNIPDKESFYTEIYRVLRPGGVLAIYDVLAGKNKPVIYPVPWARSEQASFLATGAELRNRLESSGFTVTIWEDDTAAAGSWFAAQPVVGEGEQPRPLGMHLLLGEDWRLILANLRQNLREERIELCRVVAVKSAGGSP